MAYTRHEIWIKVRGIEESETVYADEELILQLAELNNILE